VEAALSLDSYLVCVSLLRKARRPFSADLHADGKNTNLRKIELSPKRDKIKRWVSGFSTAMNHTPTSRSGSNTEKMRWTMGALTLFW
jgi:hypothetical protein